METFAYILSSVFMIVFGVAVFVSLVVTSVDLDKSDLQGFSKLVVTILNLFSHIGIMLACWIVGFTLLGRI